MFNAILNHPTLSLLQRQTCDENDVHVTFSDAIEEAFDDKILILKVDAFYDTVRFPLPPPSIDCLIIVKCGFEGWFDFYLIELRNVNSPRGFNVENVREKFVSTIEDFLKERFADIFLSEIYRLNNLKLFFVSDAYRVKKRFPDISDEEYRKKFMGPKLDAIASLKPFRFRDKIATIIPMLPNPMIDEC